MDEKLKKLANMIINYSLKLKKDEKVSINCSSIEVMSLVKYLIEEIYLRDAIPYVNFVEQEIASLLLEKTNLERVKLLKSIGQFEVDNYDAFIYIRYSINDYEGKNVNEGILKMIGENLKEINDIKTNDKKWVLLNYPSFLDAYKAKMKISEFYNYALDVMNIDYQQMSIDVKPLIEILKRTDKVRLTGKETDLTFSIKNMPIVSCMGDNNIPDGEIFMAPIKNSANGYITYNTPSPFRGRVFNNVKLVFKEGEIIEATCEGDTEALNKIFDVDEDSRYVGEFAIGLNPLIKSPMGDVLYDEKIIGSIHFTPGKSYKRSNNDNNSSIHWDMVLIQRSEYGGGNIYFDDVLVRENGLFVLEELKHLNYNLNK